MLSLVTMANLAPLRSLRFRLMLLILPAVLPAIGLICLRVVEQRQAAYENARLQAGLIARSAAEKQAAAIEAAGQMLFILGQIPAIRTDNPTACHTALASVIQHNPRYTNIVKADLQAHYLCDAYSASSGMRVHDLAMIDRAVQTRSPTSGEYMLSPSTGRPVLPLAYPLLDDGGQVSAVLVAGLDLAFLNDLAAQTLLLPGSTLEVEDRAGAVLVQYPSPAAPAAPKNPDAGLARRRLSSGRAGTVEILGQDGIRRLYALTSIDPSGGSEVTILVGIPVSAAYAAIVQNLTRSLLVLVAVMLLLSAAAWLQMDFFFIRPQQALVRAAGRMAAGDLQSRTGLSGDSGEMGRLAQAFDQMAAALEQHAREQKSTFETLQKAEAARERLLRQIITAHEDERLRIARELHDETSQSLTALMLGIDTAILAQEKDPARVNAHLANVRSIADGLLVETHRLINNLRPALLDDLGLLPAISMWAEKLLGACEINLNLVDDSLPGRLPGRLPSRLPAAIETALFRIVQEAVTNVVRHSRASTVTIRLQQTLRRVSVQISDDGLGFDPALVSSQSRPDGFGLLGIQERVRMLEGEFQIQASPHGGATISVSIPLPDHPEEDRKPGVQA